MRYLFIKKSFSERSMSFRLGVLSGLALIGAAAISPLSAQSTTSAARAAQTDSRWYPFLGCWASDTAAGRAAHAGAMCIVPVSGSTGVESLSLIDGKIILRHRLDANGRAQPIDNQGCTGHEVATW